MSTKFQKTSIPFLDTEVYIKNNKLYTKIYRKQTDHQSSFHIDSDYLKLLKGSIPYSQALKIKLICTTSKNVNHHCKELKYHFLEQGYNSELLDKRIKTVEKLDSNKLIKGNKKHTLISTRIPLAITYSPFLPNISKIIRNNWKILSVNKSLKRVFQNDQVTAFKHKKNLKELISSNKKAL